jgi:hypothetical protein
MGAIQAQDAADLVNEGMFPMETMLYHHLQYNLYPGHGEFIDVALAAIELANQGDWDATVNIAEIMEDEKYNKTAPVADIINGWRLEFFLDQEETEW